MPVNANSLTDCQQLIDRIRKTLAAQKYNLNNIQEIPKQFPKSDDSVLEGLSRAILTRQAEWKTIDKILPNLKADLLNYNVNKVSALTNINIQKLYEKYKGSVRARFFKDELLAIRNNAKVFQSIILKHGSVLAFIKSYLPVISYNRSYKGYINPADDSLIQLFTAPESSFKLSAVGLAICCEFFNNIGIDEFKPDVHTSRFLNRLGIVSTQKNNSVRMAGLTIANTLGKSRKYVDSHIWVYCADGEGEICSKNPQCHICLLKNMKPRICWY